MCCLYTSLPTSENGWAKLCCFLLIKLFHLFLKLFLSPEAVAEGLPIIWLLFQSSVLQCNCQRYSELQEPIIILLTCKKLLSTYLVNTYSSKTLGTLLILNYLYWEYLFICYIRYHFLLCCKKVGIQKYWLSSEDMKSQVCCTSIIVLCNNISLFTMFLTQGQGYGKPPQGASKLGKKKETRQKCQEAVKHALFFSLYKSWCCILILSFFFQKQGK